MDKQGRNMKEKKEEWEEKGSRERKGGSWKALYKGNDDKNRKKGVNKRTSKIGM